MKSINRKIIARQIHQGITRSKYYAQPILVSCGFQINFIDPLQFFSSGEKNFQGKRFFWTVPDRSLHLVGLGYSKKIEVRTTKERFSQINLDWDRLKNQALIYPEESCCAYDRGPLLFGGFSYDPEKQKSGLWADFPEGMMMLPKYMLTASSDGESWLTINLIVNQGDNPEAIINIISNELQTIANHEKTPHPAVSQLLGQEDIDPLGWMTSVTRAAADIREKKLDKVVMAREIRLKFKDPLSVWEILRNLYQEQPSSYIFALEHAGNCFLGASPELLIKKREHCLSAMCLAGSIGRGSSHQEDHELEENILHDRKNLNEHAIVVRMIRQVMEESCLSVSLPNAPILCKYRDIQHLYTPITGQAKETLTVLDLVEKLHPTPALGGYPKVAALSYIRRAETMDRGWYAAPIGWMNYQKEGEFAVGIRSGLIKDNSVSLFAGCGIIGDSDAENEYMETKIKFKPMLLALGGSS